MSYNEFGIRQRRAGIGAAVLAVVLLAGGVTWQSLEAEQQPAASAAVAAQSVTRAVSPVVAGGRESYADAVRAVSPAVVEVRVKGRAQMSPTGLQDEDLFRRFFGEPRPGPRQPAPMREGVGSGVIVSPDGYVLTNHHVVRGASQIVVELKDARMYDATVIGSDEPSDLALLKVEGTNLPVVPIGDSNAVEVGDVVLAIGNPLNLGQTVTMGIISAKGRTTGTGDGSYEDFLQTDAAINQGNSGGALVTTSGQLIGINSQILSPSGGNIGIGFAIPSNMARHVMDELKTEGRVRRSQLGVVIQTLNADMASSLGVDRRGGVIVSEVSPDSPASRAGVERQDIITTFNGQAVTDVNALRNRVAEMKPGTTATLGVIRDGKERTLTATVAEADASSRRARNTQEEERANQMALGLTVAPLTPDLRSRAGVPETVNGLIVQQVTPESRAASAGIQPGDVIQQVNRVPVRSAEDLRAAVSKTGERPALLLLNRDGRDLFVAVRPS